MSIIYMLKISFYNKISKFVNFKPICNFKPKVMKNYDFHYFLTFVIHSNIIIN